MEGGHKAFRITRASGQIPKFHSVATFVAHVHHGGPGCLNQSVRKSQCQTDVNLLAASRCWAPILRRMHPRTNPIPQHHTATIDRTTNSDLSFATNVRT